MRRYERFLAEVRLEGGRDGGREVRAHCVNPGRMEGLVVPGARVWLSRSDATAGRALAFTWELVEVAEGLVGVNTVLPNALAGAVLEGGLVEGFDDVRGLRAEQRFGDGRRVDFVVEHGDGVAHHVEVKNCHLVYGDGYGYFPDSRSERATHHVEALGALARAGGRTTVLFTVQRADARGLRPSDLHDPTFAAAVRHAAGEGVRFRALRFVPTLEGLWLDGELPVDLAPYDVAAARAFGRALERASGWVRKDGRWAGQALPAGTKSTLTLGPGTGHTKRRRSLRPGSSVGRAGD